MVLLPNWLDERRIPIENGSEDEEIPKASKNRRSSGKSRILVAFLLFTILSIFSCASFPAQYLDDQNENDRQPKQYEEYVGKTYYIFNDDDPLTMDILLNSLTNRETYRFQSVKVDEPSLAIIGIGRTLVFKFISNATNQTVKVLYSVARDTPLPDKTQYFVPLTGSTFECKSGFYEVGLLNNDSNYYIDQENQQIANNKARTKAFINNKGAIKSTDGKALLYIPTGLNDSLLIENERLISNMVLMSFSDPSGFQFPCTIEEYNRLRTWLSSRYRNMWELADAETEYFDTGPKNNDALLKLFLPNALETNTEYALYLSIAQP